MWLFLVKNLPREKKNALMSMINLWLKQTQSQFRREFYIQDSGVSIGNSASSLVADFYINDFETEIKNDPIFPRVLIRYVDDYFAIIKNSQRQAVLHLFNSVHPSIQFTTEVESDGSIPFLDLKITRNDNGTLSFEVYRKPTDSP